MTTEMTRRITSAIAETKHLIAKELRYSKDLQNKDYLTDLNGHVAKLNKMMEVK